MNCNASPEKSLNPKPTTKTRYRLKVGANSANSHYVTRLRKNRDKQVSGFEVTASSGRTTFWSLASKGKAEAVLAELNSNRLTQSNLVIEPYEVEV